MLLKIVPLVMALAGPGGLLSDPEAQAKFQEAQEAFQAEDFVAAAKAVEAAYLIEPEPLLLYPWAQAERSQGNCKVAIELYQRFIDSNAATEEMIQNALENQTRCQEQIDAEEEEEIVEEIIDDDPEEVIEEEEELPPPSKEIDDEPKAKAWYKDPVGGVLAGLGVVGVGVGAGLLGSGSSTAGQVSDEDMHTDYLAQRDRATGLRNGGAVAMSLGGALLVGGVVRYLLVARKNKQAATAWRWQPGAGPRFTGVVFSRRF